VAASRPPRRDRWGWSERCKLLLDLSLAVILFALALPLMLLVAALVKLTSRGPALYCQLRVGRCGKPFLMYKFRTMWHDCEKKTGAQWSRPGDPRVTPLGRFLRASHIDELPQLINVLCGQMSLVGPRPERPEFVPQLGALIPGYQDRLEVRPGVTGLAQVQLGPDTDLGSVCRKLLYDCWYIDNRSLWLDVRLILCTAMKVFFVPMPICCRFFRIPGAAVVERASRIVKVQPTPPALAPLEPSDSSGEIPVAIQMEVVR
jgi:lipopolysaccharide/colanic/teichoic acid biosynthesis glycosyltransferase